MANRDPRHMGQFAAAWSIGYAAAVASTGLDQLILSGFAGPFGVLAAEDEPVPAGQLRPVFHAIEGLARMASSTSVEVRSGARDRVAALAARSADGRLVLWLANLTADEVILDRSDLPVGLDAPVSVLDAKSVQAGEGFRMIDHRSEICLGAYAVARMS
jgi:D-apionolactonase